MKKNHIYIGLGAIAIIATICIVKKIKKSNDLKTIANGVRPIVETIDTTVNSESESEFLGLSPRISTKVPKSGQVVSKWVSSQEGGNSFCRWYDGNGNNTVTYNRPCTKAQANM